jgi:hypothetical protein
MNNPNPPDGQAGAPGDVPGGRPAALDGLDVLVGQWEMEASFGAGFFGPGTAPATQRGGLTTFEWLEGRYFLIQRFVVDNPVAPSGIAIIGPGGVPGTLEQHYYDSRGVARVYQVSLDGETWKVWREAPGFWQRYSGVVSDDGTVIAGAWEKSADGLEWERDFGLTYIKVG